MDAGQSERALRFLESKWQAPRTCQVCGTDSWLVLDKLYELREFSGGAILLGGAVLPVLAAQCSNCGHLLFFNAIAAGGASRDASDAPEGVASHDAEATE